MLDYSNIFFLLIKRIAILIEVIKMIANKTILSAVTGFSFSGNSVTETCKTYVPESVSK